MNNLENWFDDNFSDQYEDIVKNGFEGITYQSDCEELFDEHFDDIKQLLLKTTPFINEKTEPSVKAAWFNVAITMLAMQYESRQLIDSIIIHHKGDRSLTVSEILELSDGDITIAKKVFEILVDTVTGN